jgi:phosphate-selective porin OprO/OprP
MKIRSLFAATIAVQFFAMTAPAVEISDEKLDALLKRINELEQKVDALQKKDAARPAGTATNLTSDAAAEPITAKSEPSVSLGMNGLLVRSADSNFVFNLHGYTQADARFYFGEKTLPDTFLLRRVRPIFEGTIYSMFDYRLMLDFA